MGREGKRKNVEGRKRGKWRGNQMRSGKERRRKGEGKGGEWKVMFWNVTELANKDKEFCEGLKKWNNKMVVLSETWMEEKGWNRWKGEFNKGVCVKMAGIDERGQERKGSTPIANGNGDRKRFSGRMIGGGGGGKGIIVERIRVRDERWRIVGMYVGRRDIVETLQRS